MIESTFSRSLTTFMIVTLTPSIGCNMVPPKDAVTDDAVHIPMNTMIASGSNCVGMSDFQNLDGLDFGDDETFGSESSSVPDSSSYVVTRRDSGPTTACMGVETNARLATSGNRTTTAWIENWYAVGGEGPRFLLCNKYDGTTDCRNSGNDACNGVYKVTLTNASGCSSYDPVNVFLDASSSSLMAQRKMDGDAACVAGSGRFQLVPVQMGDRDRDGVYHYAMLPIQKTGTGVMTRSAWVTSIAQVSVPSGRTLRVIKSDQRFSFDNTDALKNANTVSSVVNSTNTYATGVIDGNPTFVVSELPLSDLDDFTVDMAWSCSSNFTESNSPQGYQFRLADIGCTGLNQKMTLRVGTSPNRVSIEQYGTAAVGRTEPTQTTTEGRAFSFDRGPLSIDGVVVSNNAQQAVVNLNYIRWDGNDICGTGTYTFAAE